MGRAGFVGQLDKLRADWQSALRRLATAAQNTIVPHNQACGAN